MTDRHNAADHYIWYSNIWFAYLINVDYQGFLSFASDFSFQPLNAGKLWEML